MGEPKHSFTLTIVSKAMLCVRLRPSSNPLRRGRRIDSTCKWCYQNAPASMAFLDQILERKKIELTEVKQLRPQAVLKEMIRDAPPALSLSSALMSGFGLIAEIKRKSPSGGDMPPKNVEAAPA